MGEFIAKQGSTEASWLNIKQLTEPRAAARELTSTRTIEAMTSTQYIAVDIAKETLAVHCETFHGTFAYTHTGLHQILHKIQQLPNPLVVCEATGGYERKLIEWLRERQIPNALVNPARVRAFARSDGLKAKTDPIDAALLLKFAISKRIAPSEAPSPQRLLLQALMDRRSQLCETITQEKNRLEKCPKPARKSIEKVLRMLQKELTSIEQQIEAAIAKDQTMIRQSTQMQTVTGIGKTTAWTILAYLHEIIHLKRNQVTALAGIAPIPKDSGTFKGKRRIEGGRAKVRNCLYMAAQSAAVHNPHIRAYFQGLQARGKPYKCAIVAAMRKLLLHLQSILKKDLEALA